MQTRLQRSCGKRPKNFLRGVAVAEWIGRVGRRSGLPAGQPVRRARNDFFPGSPHQLRPAGFDSFRTFRDFPHNEYRGADRRCFFLNATGVRKNERGALHQVDKFRVRKRVNEKNSWLILQARVDGSMNRGIRMDRQNDRQL